MIAPDLRARAHAALDVAVRDLVGRLHPEGYWEGYLSSSALSTATAVSALAMAAQAGDRSLIEGGAAWLGAHQNADGGWGDTTDSPSNLATTWLSVAALHLAGTPGEAAAPLARADAYLTRHAGKGAGERVAALRKVYGADRTFAVPILMNCALAGLVPWREIPGLPCELAAFPHAWYRMLRLHVVSYALPALIAIGQLLHYRNPPRNPVKRLMRRLAECPALAKLERIQPESGGYLEATPLTSFVAMSLTPLRGPEHPVMRQCLRFLRDSVRRDGSWPIDTNLSVWMTTSALTALAQAGRLDAIDAAKTRSWVAAQQVRAVHPYTNAAPGGWGWSHLSGSVPDADDTSGAIVALAQLGEREALPAGVGWLLGLQNSDGGWPTFCRGWGQLPFDRSSPDITAHALRALRAAEPQGPDARSLRAMQGGIRYLRGNQRPDGAWVPLWFGNQAAPEHANAVLGTARVLLALAELDSCTDEGLRGVQYLVGAQSEHGGWGGDRGVTPSVEETALAVSALSSWGEAPGAPEALARGVGALVGWIEEGSWRRAAPIGLYFASLWYSEELYPVIWTVEALGRALSAGAR